MGVPSIEFRVKSYIDVAGAATPARASVTSNAQLFNMQVLQTDLSAQSIDKHSGKFADTAKLFWSGPLYLIESTSHRW